MGDRLISADALKQYIDNAEFCTNCPKMKVRCSYECDLPDCLTAQWERVIDEQPTVHQEPEWVPVSERLPENDNAVLITHKSGVGKAWWNGRFWTSLATKKYKTVIAWMPLPEPYEPKETE